MSIPSALRALGAAARSNRRVLASLRLPHFRQKAALSLPCLGIYHWLRTRASPTPASQDLSSCATAAPHALRYIHCFARGESPGNGGASLVVRFMIERLFRHTSTRGSVAPRRTSNRRFIGDCIHPALLRRGIRLRQRRQVARRAKRGALRSKVARGRATEPPDSHSLPYTRSTCSTRPNLSAHSASLR